MESQVFIYFESYWFKKLVRLPSTAFKGSFSTFPITLPGGHIEFYDSIQVDDLKIVKGIPLQMLDPFLSNIPGRF